MKTEHLLRWIGLAPAAFLSASLVYIVLRLWLFVSGFIPWAWLRDITNWTNEVMATLLAGIVAVAVAFMVAPVAKMKAATVIAILGVLYAVANAALQWSELGRPNVTGFVCLVLGFIAGNYFLDEPSVGPKPDTSETPSR